MYTPMYRFRYKFDSKQNKYIPTNEWFMDKVIIRKQGGNLNKVQFVQKGKPITKFGVLGRNPKDANRTPQWDAEEDKIFNPTEDDNFLKSKNINYTKNGIYYLDEKGKYLPGIIYHSPDGKTWNHYVLGPNGIEGFDNRNLSLEQYKIYKDTGLDFSKFFGKYSNPKDYIPREDLKLPRENYKVGNSTITFKSGFPWERAANGQKPNGISLNNLRNYTDYGSWHVVDPDNGYDFIIRSGRLRDGGSRSVDLQGNYPSEWKQHTGIIRYNGVDDNQDEYDSAENRRNALNNIFKAYNLQFDKQGGKLNKYQFGGKNLSKAPKAEDRYKNGYKHKGFTTLWHNGDGIETATVLADNKIQFGKFPAVIQRTIYTNSSNPEKQDTIYKERPEFRQFPILFQERDPMRQHEIPSILQPKVKIRQASSKDKNRSEYEILRRRFNTAWNLAK